MNYAHITSTSILIPIRAFRLLRIFKLAKNWRDFRHLLSTIARTLKGIGPFLVLLSLFIFVYASIGIKLFKKKVKIDEEGMPNVSIGSYPDSNFNNYFDAFLCIFIVLNNDGWSTIFV